MYETHFRLHHRPFASAPRADRYFAAGPIETARQTLARCIERAEGVGLLLGPSGTGKTLLLQTLADQFRGRFAVVTLSNTHLTTRRALLQAILFDLGLPYRGLDEGELRLSLIDYLEPTERCPQGLLLLIDESHALPVRLLEEVRMITNLVRSGQPRVRLVFAGSHALEERLASPKLSALNQRITARCYLQALNHHETVGYVRALIAAAGGSPDQLFASDAFDAIYRATDGVPRLINQLCDHALVLAFAGGQHQVPAAGIEEAWADLQQLPTPWNERSAREELAIARRDVEIPTETHTQSSDSVIEFGTLDDDDVSPTALPLEPIPSANLSIGQRATIRLDKIGAQLEAAESNHPPVETKPAELSIAEEQDIEEDDDYEFALGNDQRPEAELVFSNLADPFGDAFIDEEVVFDRYASADAMFASRKSVRSAEGKLLSALLDPFVRASNEQSVETKPKFSVMSPAEHLEADQADAERAAVDSVSTKVHQLPEQSESDSFAHTPILHSQSSSPIHEPIATFVEHRPSSNVIEQDADSTDEDMIVIEDDPVYTPPDVPAPEVRRQEYSRLFASLRRS